MGSKSRFLRFFAAVSQLIVLLTVTYIYLFILMAAVGVVQYLIGGTRLLFSLPGYELLAVGSFLTLFSIRQVKSSPRLNCLLATALLFTYLLVRCVYSPIDYLARPDYFTILGCLMVYFLTCFYLTQSRPRIYFIFFLLALALVHVWVGAIQFTDPEQTYMLQGFLKRGPDSRACGLLIGPNVYAGYLEAVGVMGFSLVWWSRLKFWLKLILFYVSACCYVGIALSGSRGGYFSSTASILMLIALSLYAIRVVDRQKFARLAVVSALLFAMTLGGAVFLMGHSALIQSRMSKMVAHDMRIYMWQASLDDFKTSPTIGTGSGTYLYFGAQKSRTTIRFIRTAITSSCWLNMGFAVPCACLFFCGSTSETELPLIHGSCAGGSCIHPSLAAMPWHSISARFRRLQLSRCIRWSISICIFRVTH